MKLKEHLTQKSLESRIARFWKLREIKAPGIILRNDMKAIRELQRGIVHIKDIDQFNTEFEKIESHTGRGGKVHLKVWLSDGRIIGIFSGPYSRFAKIWKDKENL